MVARIRLGSAFVGTLLAAAPAALAAQEQPEIVLNVGDEAPNFAAVSDDGSEWRSEDHVGKEIVVVYFYPAAMSSGCTKQACAFRDHRSQLEELGATVVGVSGDRLENLTLFRNSNRLNFPLLSDPEGEVARAFGVPVRDGGTYKGEIEGREVELVRDVTIARWTFVIGRDGRIVLKETEVDPEGDSARVLEAIRQLGDAGL